jgi:glycosyltransferase involved in cell wall biosynthesis
MTTPNPVLQVNKFLHDRGGLERYLQFLFGDLERRGHHVVTFAMADPRNWPSPYSEYFVSPVSFPRQVGLRNSLTATRGFLRAIYSRAAHRQVLQLVHDTRPQIAHVHEVFHQLSPSVLVALREAGVPVVLHAHEHKLICPTVLLHDGRGICEACKGHRYWQPLVRRCSAGSLPRSAAAAVEATVHHLLGLYSDKYAPVIVAGSRFTMAKHQEFGIAPERMELLPYVLDPAEWAPPTQEPGDYFVFAGRLDTGKGVPTLLRALRLAGDPPMLITGTGPARAEFERQAAELGLTNLRFTGWLEEAELRTTVAGSLAALFTSEGYETFGYSAYEALAAGRAVVASRLGPLPELVQEGETGLLFEAGNAEDLASKLRELRADRDLARKLGRQARAFFDERNDPDRHYERLMEIYERVGAKVTLPPSPGRSARLVGRR